MGDSCSCEVELPACNDVFARCHWVRSTIVAVYGSMQLLPASQLFHVFAHLCLLLNGTYDATVLHVLIALVKHDSHERVACTHGRPGVRSDAMYQQYLLYLRLREIHGI